MENWKDVLGYEGLYQVSDLGNIKSLSKILLNKGKFEFLSKERFLKFAISGGYKSVKLYKNGSKRSIKVHQLVAIAFLNHKPDGTQKLVVNHKNIIKTDNRLCNLEVITQRQNANQKHLKSSSQFIGVSWRKDTQKWQAYISINKKRFSLGCFVNEIDAHNAYEKANFEFYNESPEMRNSGFVKIGWRL